MPTDAALRTITIDARSAKDYDPDVFVVQIEFEGERSERAECVKAYNRDYARVKAALISAGVPEEEIHNGEFSVTVHYEWYYEKDQYAQYERYRRTERYVDGCGYHGSCTLGGTVNREVLASIWIALQNIEGDFTYEIIYALERPEVCEQELLRSAVESARMRAETLVDAAGAHLGPVASIMHSFRNATYGYTQDVDALMCYGEAMDAGYEDDSDAPIFDPEKINVTCDVTISWSIED